LDIANQIGLDHVYSARLLNLLLIESVDLQKKQKTDVPRSSHMDILMKARKLESSGKKMIHLEIGEPDFGPPSDAKVAFVNAIDSGYHHYTDVRGIERLREKLAEAHGFDKDEVMVTPGGRFGVYASISTLVNPGEEIVIIEPSWPAYSDCAILNSIKIKTVKTTLENGWSPDLEEIENAINDSTKMIVLNYPNNPTGKILDGRLTEKILSLVRDQRLYLLSDEVYSKYCFCKYRSIAEYNYDKSIIIDSFSKTYAMTGFRLGYVLSSETIIKQLAKLQAYAMTSVAEPLQYCALNVLESDYQANVLEIRNRLRALEDRLNNMNVEFVAPEGAMYVFPRINRIQLNDLALVSNLLERGVAVAPGSAFGRSYDKFFRISATQPTDIITQAMDTLENCLSDRK
jgi:aspartate aminotransferase